jgi:hypothetical protein
VTAGVSAAGVGAAGSGTTAGTGGVTGAGAAGFSVSAGFSGAAGFGFSVTPHEFHWSRLKAARDIYVANLNGGYERNLRKNGVEIIGGRDPVKQTVITTDRNENANLIAEGPRNEGSNVGFRWQGKVDRQRTCAESANKVTQVRREGFGVLIGLFRGAIATAFAKFGANGAFHFGCRLIHMPSLSRSHLTEHVAPQ